MKIVERELLDKILAELKLSSSELADPDTALRLGKILSAGLIATGSITRYKKDYQISIRLTDTETTAIKGVIVASGRDLNGLVQDVAGKIMKKIKTAYPIRGKVMMLEGDRVVLNIGTEAGVKNGMVFKVLENAAAENGGTVRLKPAGTLTIASAEPDLAYATAAGQTQGLKKEMKVEEMMILQ